MCDLTNWGSDEYHMKKEGLVVLLDLTPNKHPTQVHCITERHHLDDIVGEGWDDQDLKRYLGWQASDYIDDPCKKGSITSRSV